jgi:uncharacterized membrane protein YeaQ/YmgE (transglycosylase-associated protein family)
VELTALIIMLVSGIAGGYAANVMAKSRSLGLMVNMILGALGGVGGGLFIAPGVGGGTVGLVAASVLIGILLPLAVSFFVKKEKKSEAGAAPMP